MNPWGSEAPMMTFAVQAYQHQWLLQVGLILQEISLINQRILARSSYTYSEKATNFFEIVTLLLSYVVPIKSKVKSSQNFVAFSEDMNFT